MTQCALINIATRTVENIIMASADDSIQDGYSLIENPPRWVTVGTEWNGSSFVAPTPPVGAAAPVIKGVETI
jgi:hypothetical protein